MLGFFTSYVNGMCTLSRATEDDTLRTWSQQNDIDLVDVVEAGLRLIYNGHIDSIGYMIVVALAEI